MTFIKLVVQFIHAEVNFMFYLLEVKNKQVNTYICPL